MNHRMTFRTGAVVLLLLAFGLSTAVPVLAQPGPEDKVDSLRWAAMQWENEGMAEIANWRDSLYACITTEEDNGSGVRTDPGEGEGISVTTRGPDLNTFIPGEGITIVWEGKDDPEGVPYDVAIVDLVDEPDPADGTTPGIGVGVHFPELFDDKIRIVVFNDNETPLDTVITDPGPDPPGPGGFPFPDPPTIVWIDTGFPPTELCDKHFLSNDGLSSIGPQRTAATAVSYELTLAEAVPLKVRGSSKTVMGNRLVIIPQNTVKVPQFITTAHAIPRHMMEAVLIHASVKQFGVEHHGLGNPLITLDPGQLTVTNIGSSGLDGVRTTLPEGTASVWTDMQPLSLRNGETLSWTLFGHMMLGAENSTLLNDSLVGFFLRGIGEKTFFSIDAQPTTGWDEFTMQFVKNGVVLRERKVPNGFTFGIRNLVITGFAKTDLANQGWEGFKIDILRNGAAAEIRFVPSSGTALSDFTYEEMHLVASSPFEDMEVAYEEIIWTVIGTVTPRVAGESDFGMERDVSDISEAPRLQGNYPEPFNPVTTIRYTLPQAVHVRLEVFDMTGRRVALLADGERAPGHHAARFDGGHLASGLYLYRLMAGSVMQSRTMLLVK